MSARGVDFVENWVSKNVTDADRNGSRERAQALAAECVADAAALGITIDDMEPERGSIETIIHEAIQSDMDAELEFWKAFAAARKEALGYREES